MVTFTWSDSYSVGLKELDEQHKYMLKLGNSLEDITSIEKAKELLEELTTFIQTHFEYEENHMREIGYPFLTEHHEEHVKLANICTEVNLLLDTGVHQAVKRIRILLANWIIDHIMYEDKKYFTFAQNRGK